MVSPGVYYCFNARGNGICSSIQQLTTTASALIWVKISWSIDERLKLWPARKWTSRFWTYPWGFYHQELLTYWTQWSIDINDLDDWTSVLYSSLWWSSWQTWDLSKILHCWIFRPKILHHHFHQISTVWGIRTPKKWLKMETFTPLAKILHCRRQWQQWQISPLFLDLLAFKNSYIEGVTASLIWYIPQPLNNDWD